MKLIEAMIAMTVFTLTVTVSLPLLRHSMEEHRLAAERIARVAEARERIDAFERACEVNELPSAPVGCAIRTLVDGRGTTLAIMTFDLSGKKIEIVSEVRHEDDNP